MLTLVIYTLARVKLERVLFVQWLCVLIKITAESLKNHESVITEFTHILLSLLCVYTSQSEAEDRPRGNTHSNHNEGPTELHIPNPKEYENLRIFTQKNTWHHVR